MKYYILIIAVLYICIATGAPLIRANGFGLKFDKPVGDYIANIDTNTYGLTDAEPVRFDFQLWNKDRSMQLDFDNVWVNITPTGAFNATFAGMIGKPEFGGVGMTYFFPKPGNYDMSIRFGKTNEKGEIETLAEASFPMTVTKDEMGAGLPSRVRDFLVAFILGIMLGAGCIYLLKRK